MRFWIFSRDFSPFFEVQYLARVIWTEKNGEKAPKRFQKILDDSHRDGS
jgi:hypothetical protein